MKINIHPDEIIGKSIKVMNSTNPSEIGMKGKIVDETKNTLVLDTKKGEKILFKNNIKIMIGNKIIEGKKLLKRPEERIK